MKVIVLAGAWCGDCVNQCPILDHFAAATAKIANFAPLHSESADLGGFGPVELPPRAWYPGLRPAIHETVLAEAELAVALDELALQQYEDGEGGTFQIDLQDVDHDDPDVDLRRRPGVARSALRKPCRRVTTGFAGWFRSDSGDNEHSREDRPAEQAAQDRWHTRDIA